MRRTMVVVAVLVTGSVLVGGSANAGSRHRGSAEKAAKTVLLARVRVAASEFKFVLSRKTARRGVVTFVVTNVGRLEHNFQIRGRRTRLLSRGQSATLRVTFLRGGHFAYI